MDVVDWIAIALFIVTAILLVLILFSPSLFTKEVEVVVTVGDQATTAQRPLPSYGPVPEDLKARVARYQAEEKKRVEVQKRNTILNHFACLFVILVFPLLFSYLIFRFSEFDGFLLVFFFVPFAAGVYGGFIFGRFSAIGAGGRALGRVGFFSGLALCLIYTFLQAGTCGLFFAPVTSFLLFLGIFLGHLFGGLLNPIYPD